MNNKVSIIVPVYNVEMHLHKCIESIINQTYKNLEILLIDDGSKDNSGKICDQFAKKDSRIKVIHKKNGGLPDARNRGLELATGEYVSFIDSDDWIDPQMIEELLQIATKHNVEVVMSTISSESEFTKKINKFPWPEDRIFNEREIKEEFLPHLISSIDTSGKLIQTITGSVCKCLYQMKFLKAHNIFFDIKVGSGEDKEFSLRVFTKIMALYTTNSCYYHYNRSVLGGGSTTQRYSPNLYEKVSYRQSKYISTLKEAGIYDTHYLGLNLTWLETILAVIDNMCYEGNPRNFKKIIENVKYVLEDSNFFELLNYLNEDQLVYLNKRKVNLIKNRLPMYIGMKKTKIMFKKQLVKSKFLMALKQ